MKNLYSKLNLKYLVTGCCLIVGLLLSVKTIAQPFPGASESGASCGGGASINFTPTGDDGSGYNIYLYNSSNSLVTSTYVSDAGSGSFTMLQPDTYYLYAEDYDNPGDGQYQYGLVVLTGPANNSPVIGVPSPLCVGSSATFTEISGYSFSTYNWSGDGAFSGIDPASGNVSDISSSSGSVYLTVTDGYGCQATTSTGASPTTPPSAEVDYNYGSVCGGGTAYYYNPGACGTCNYNWSADGSLSIYNPGGNNTGAQGTGSGDIDLTVTDMSTGCSASGSLPVSVDCNTPIQATGYYGNFYSDNGDSYYCAGIGSLYVNITGGGNGSGSYNVYVDGGFASGGSVGLVPLTTDPYSSGSHTITVTDGNDNTGNGNGDDISFTITIPSPDPCQCGGFSLSNASGPTATPDNCSTSIGTVSGQISGGSGAYNIYLLNNSSYTDNQTDASTYATASNIDNTTGSYSFSNLLGPVTYYVVAYDNCNVTTQAVGTSGSLSAYVDNTSNSCGGGGGGLAVSISGPNSPCTGDQDTYYSGVNGGNPPYSGFQWSVTGGTITGGTQYSDPVTVTWDQGAQGSANVHVQVQDANSVTVTGDYSVTVTACTPQISWTGYTFTDNTGCTDFPNGSATGTVATGTGPFTFTLYEPDGVTQVANPQNPQTTSGTFSFTGLTGGISGSYLVTATDGNGDIPATGAGAANGAINNYSVADPSPSINVNSANFAGSSVNLCAGTSNTFTTDNYSSYVWNLDGVDNGGNSSSATYTLSTSPGPDNIGVTVTTSNGCTGSSIGTINIQNCGITPNASSTNYTSCNSNDGTVSATPGGGDGSGFIFTLTGAVYGVQPTQSGASCYFTGLLADTYSLLVQDADAPGDANAATQPGLTVTAYVGVQMYLAGTDFSDNTACAPSYNGMIGGAYCSSGGTVTITAIDPSVGTPYTTQVPGGFCPGATQFTLCPVPAGNYNITATDDVCDVPATSTATIYDYAGCGNLSLSNISTTDNTACSPNFNGSVGGLISGANAPSNANMGVSISGCGYSYGGSASYDGGGNWSFSVSGLAPCGSYSISISDQWVGASNDNSYVCGGPYGTNYSSDNGTGGSATINDASLCDQQIQASVTGSTPATTTCSQDGSITISAVGGLDAGYSYSLDGAYPVAFTSGNSTTISGLISKNYTIVVYDALWAASDWEANGGSSGYDTYKTTLSYALTNDGGACPNNCPSFPIPADAQIIYQPTNVGCYTTTPDGNANIWVCAGESYTITSGCGGSPNVHIYLEPGATFYNAGGGGSFNVYMRAGSTFNGDGGGIIYADPSANINAGYSSLTYCPNLAYDYTNAPAGGCSGTPQQIQLTLNANNDATTDCINDGSATITGEYGDGIESYNWFLDGNPVQSGGNVLTVTSIAAGQHTVEAEDMDNPGDGYTNSITFTTAPIHPTCGTPITFTVNETNASCYVSGGQNATMATIFVQVTGGGNYTGDAYLIDYNGPNIGSFSYNYQYGQGVDSAIITVTAAGPVTIDVFDENYSESDLGGLTLWSSQTIMIDPVGPVANIYTPSDLCDQTFETFATDDTFSSYTWSADGSASLTPSGAPLQSVSLGSQGNADVYLLVTDANNCTATATSTFTVIDCSSSTLSINLNAPVNNDHCLSPFDGSLSGNIGGATDASVTVSCSCGQTVTATPSNGYAFSFTALQGGVSPGTAYTISASDADDVSATASNSNTTVIWNCGMTVNFGSPNAYPNAYSLSSACNANTGSVYLVATGGSTENYIWSINPDPGGQGASVYSGNGYNETVSYGINGPGLPAGTYDVTVSDGAGFSATVEVDIAPQYYGYGTGGPFSPPTIILTNSPGGTYPGSCSNALSYYTIQDEGYPGWGGYNFMWSVNTDPSYVQGSIVQNPPTVDAATVQWDAPGVGELNVTLIDPNNGCTLDATPYMANIGGGDPPTIVPPANFCAGSTVTFSTQTGYTNYMWNSDGLYAQIQTYSTTSTQDMLLEQQGGGGGGAFVTLTATDADNCSVTATEYNFTVVTCSATTDITATITNNDPSTPCTSDGSVTISAVSGGDGSGNYEIDVAGVSIGTFTAGQLPLNFGAFTANTNYTITINDAGDPTNTNNDQYSYGTINLPPVSNSCGANTWLGGSTVWSDPTNWSGGNPPTGLCSESVSIPTPGGTTQEPVLTGTESVGNISLGSGASIDLGRFNLNVCGNITGGSGATDGDVLASGGGELVLNGSGLQQISGKVEVQSIHINNSAGVQLLSGTQLDIYTALELESGQFDASNGTATLKSTSVTQAAIINDFSYGSPHGTFLGNVKAERFYGVPTAPNDFKQHMLGSPVGGLNVSALGSNSGSSAYYIAATGGAHNCNELLASPNTPYGNVFSYDESHASSCTMAGWLVTAASTAASAGTGYSVVLGNGSGVLPLTGPPNLGQGYNIATTNSAYPNTTSDQGRVYTSGINLLSNPYPASLDPAKLITDNANYSAAVYVWNESTGSYYQPTTIAPFQAFKVIQTTDGGGTYTINGTSRTTTAGTFQRIANPIELNMGVTNNSTGLVDETTVGFNPNSTAQFNPAYDLIKLPGALSRHTLYTLNSSDWLWVNVLKSINETSTVPVGFEPGVSGTYTANFSGLSSFDPTSYITLEDKQAGIMHDVRSGDYTFTSGEGDNFNRFVLHFTPPASINTTSATCETSGMINIVQPGTASWNYTLADNNNVILSSGTLNVNSSVSASIPVGVYTLTLKDNNGYTVVKIIEVSGVQPVAASFTSSASSVNVNQDVNLSSTSTNAVLNSWNFGDGTTDNGATVSHAYTSEGVYSVTLNSTSASGCNSSTSNNITVTRSATGVTDLNDINSILIWSNENMVNVDFTQLKNVQANIEIYNILGQKLSEDKYVTSAVYHKEIPTIEEGYIVVSVKNNDAIITKKLFISNVK